MGSFNAIKIIEIIYIRTTMIQLIFTTFSQTLMKNKNKNFVDFSDTMHHHLQFSNYNDNFSKILT